MNLSNSNLIKDYLEIQSFKKAGYITSRIMKTIRNMLIEDGTQYSPRSLNILAETLLQQHNVVSCFKGYKLAEGVFPTNLCVAVNEHIAHTPALSTKLFKKGDIVTVDFGISYLGICTDMAFTVVIGDYKNAAEKRLVEGTKKALDKAIKFCTVNYTLADLSYVIHSSLTEDNLGVPPHFCGHFIGSDIHEPPNIPNVVRQDQVSFNLCPGMVFCLEPIATLGSPEYKLGQDGFSYITKDGSVSAQFEHQILVTDYEPIVLTSMDDNAILGETNGS